MHDKQTGLLLKSRSNIIISNKSNPSIWYNYTNKRDMIYFKVNLLNPNDNDSINTPIEYEAIILIAIGIITISIAIVITLFIRIHKKSKIL